MKEFLMNSANKTLMLTALVVIVFLYAAYNYFIEFSSFAVGLAKGVLGVYLFWIVDKYAIKEIDTIKELKKGNIAYAIFLLGIALIIASAILNS